ncbi:MAG: metallophosphoesterase [Synergistaceae bacterium]|nr:metallophosphoesterase [Synergistaceae bacterium]
MIKIFLTGDNHIGRGFKYDKADELGELRLNAFKTMADKAAEEQCDIFVIAGDLFENNYNYSQHEIESLINNLKSFHGKILILPGNHDFDSENINLWRELESKAEGKINFKILNEFKVYELNVRDERVMIFPAYCDSEHSPQGKNNLDWIKEYFNNNNNLDNNIYKIGIAHGAIEGETPDADRKYFMMSKDELNNINVDVWLIGHTHAPFPKYLSLELELINNNKIFNAGSHMQNDINDGSEGQCFIIELNNDKSIKAKKFLSGPVNFKKFDIDLNGQDLNQELDNALGSLKDNYVVELNLTGFINKNDFDNRLNIINKNLERFIDYEINYQELRPIIDQNILKEFSENSFAYKFLNNIMAEPDNNAEAYMAYSLIKSLEM